MKDDEIENLIFELRKKIMDSFVEFWESNKSLDAKSRFVVMSLCLSSIISQIVYILFNKEGMPGIAAARKKYIDDLCFQTKEMVDIAEIIISDYKDKH